MRGLAIAIAASLVLGACGSNTDPGGDRPVHVVVFLIDTLRADRLGLYGHDRATSPFLDQLASESVVFESAHSPAPWTLPSVVSLMTSRFVPEHGVIKDKQVLHESVPTLAMWLRDAGYSTASIYHNPYAGPVSGLDRGFDFARHAERDVDGSHVEEWLDASPSFPFFLYLHNTIPHDPYLPPPEFLRPIGAVPDNVKWEVVDVQKEYRRLSRVNNAIRFGATRDNSDEQSVLMDRLEERQREIGMLYDAEVAQADDFVRQVVEELKAQGVWDDTLFIVTSDHGEELGDHGGWEHDHSVYEELVHVPFLVRFPRGEFGGKRIEAPVSLIDVAPTILDYLGTELPDTTGRSLLPLIRGGASAGDQMRVTAYRWNLKKYYTPYKEVRGDENVVVRDGAWKGIWNVEQDTFELYDLANDPGETDDRSSSAVERVESMRAFAAARRAVFLERATQSAPSFERDISPEERERLKALGYLSEDDESE